MYRRGRFRTEDRGFGRTSGNLEAAEFPIASATRFPLDHRRRGSIAVISSHPVIPTGATECYAARLAAARRRFTGQLHEPMVKFNVRLV
jgi:hypothetical protein